MCTVYNEKELGKAIKENENYIEVTGDLAKKTFRIKAISKGAWAVAISSIAVAVTAILITIGTGGAAAPASAPVTVAGLTPAAVALGASGISGIAVAQTAVMIAVAGGGIGTLNKLRSYKVKKISDDKVILTLK